MLFVFQPDFSTGMYWACMDTLIITDTVTVTPSSRSWIRDTRVGEPLFCYKVVYIRAENVIRGEIGKNEWVLIQTYHKLDSSEFHRYLVSAVYVFSTFSNSILDYYLVKKNLYVLSVGP